MTANASHVKVVIIGAGLGGLSTGINLKRKLGFTNFTIYEKASDVGGTWRDNTYPGCGCDVPVHWYSLSSELNPEWTHYYADQPEILDYWRALASKYQLYPHIVFNTLVVSQTWDKHAQAWNIEVETNNLLDGTSKRHHVTAELVVAAAGGLVTPGYSNLEGMGDFGGQMFHSARWNHEIRLQGKRVGVIGNGCSAAQFIPKITQDPSVQVINFCRTPNWYVPKFQFQYTAIAKWIFRHIPWTARIHRILIAAISDLSYGIWRIRNVRARGVAEREALKYMHSKAPEKYHTELTPDYPIGCKRIIVDPGYLDALHRPNVQLEWGGVKKIVKDGLITNDGKKHELDVIICGTGFQVMNFTMRAIGRDGQLLSEYFKSRGGPEAYLGTTIPGFPNLFTILGPNTASGHASAIFSEEVQIEYALQLMRPVIEGKARSFEVRAEVCDAFNEELQRRLNDTTWTRCRSFYRAGADNMGKIIATFPGPVVQLWYWTRRVRWADYVGVDAERWARERRRRRVVGRLVGILFLATAAAAAAGAGAAYLAGREREELATLLRSTFWRGMGG